MTTGARPPLLARLRVSGCLALAAFLLLGAGRVEVYRPQGRPAEELAPIAADLLGPGGSAVADLSSGSLVLQGEPEAVESALEVLRRLDVRPRTWSVESVLTRLTELRRVGASVEGWTRAGEVRVGRVSPPRGSPPTDAGLGIRVRSILAEGETRFEGHVSVMDGRAAELWTGTTYPERHRHLRARGGEVRVYESTTLIPVRTGFRVTPFGQEDGSVELEIEPILSERGPEGQVVRSAAATRIRVQPGQRVIVASASERGGDVSIDPFGSIDLREGASDSALLVRVTPLE